MKKLLLLSCLCILMFCGGCSTSEKSAEQKQAEQTKLLLTEANNQIGMPNIVNFQQKKLMKLIYELCDKEDLICYAYIKSDYKGKLVFIGKCIGFGIPFSAQYTNPMKIIRSSFQKHADSYMGSSGPQTIPQADPNGLYMPTSSSATWLMMIDPKTKKPRPVYIECELVVSPFPLHKSIK